MTCWFRFRFFMCTFVCFSVTWSARLRLVFLCFFMYHILPLVVSLVPVSLISEDLSQWCTGHMTVA